MKIPIERIIARGILAAEIRKHYERAFRQVAENRATAEYAKEVMPLVPTSFVNRMLRKEILFDQLNYNRYLKNKLRSAKLEKTRAKILKEDELRR